MWPGSHSFVSSMISPADWHSGKGFYLFVVNVIECICNSQDTPKNPTWYIQILLKAKVEEVHRHVRQVQRKLTPSRYWGSCNRTTVIVGNLFQQRSGQQDNGILLNAFEILKIYLKRDLDGYQLGEHQLWTLAVIWLSLLQCCCGSCRLPFFSYWHHTTWISNFRNFGCFNFQSGKSRFSDCFFLTVSIEPGLGAPMSFWPSGLCSHHLTSFPLGGKWVGDLEEIFGRTHVSLHLFCSCCN